MERRPVKPIAQEMREYAERAVAAAREEGYDLDYSEESILKVEEILSVLYDSTPRGILNQLLGRTPSRRVLTELALMWGAYIGEVMRRKDGGFWTDQSVIPGAGIVLHLKPGDTTPVHKVYKRLTSGPRESVWSYFQVYKKVRAEGST